MRVHTDNLDQPFDINAGAKLELGSTYIYNLLNLIKIPKTQRPLKSSLLR